MTIVATTVQEFTGPPLRSIFGDVIGGIAGGITGFIGGGPAGAVGGAIAGAGLLPNGGGGGRTGRGTGLGTAFGGGGDCCPLGQACSFGCVGTVCLGGCKPIAPPPSGGTLNPCPEGFQLVDVGGQIICQPVNGGQAFGPSAQPTQQGDGARAVGCGATPSVCVTRGGQRGRFKCVTERGQKFTKCVANRRINPMNPKAARRATSRLNGAVKELRKIESLVKGIPIAKPRRAPRSRKGCGCG